MTTTRADVTRDALAAVGLATVTVAALGTIASAAIITGQAVEAWWRARRQS